ncbi:PH domain-containing protein [Glaciecola siphonariae]|uniref:PH domain-containing protein n=1 Tax=Glaciecola siphonariae TaxID=521012 RepID=A0ABV9LY49_9ALTE
MKDHVIASASFDKKVKAYWLVQFVLVSCLSIVFIPLIPIIAILVFVIGQRMLDAMSADLLERKLVVKRGILFKVEKSIPLEKITDVGMVQGPLMRAFGLYRLNFETAGQSGHGALVSMIGVIDAEHFRERILEQKDSLQNNAPVNKLGSAKTDGPETMTQLLASVKRIESLLEQALQNKAG